jgi:prepilin-type N-terminal cleavage/methylation domain-containing protein
MKRNGQVGFSLLEVLIAMVITVIITGVMYAFMFSSENTFRREPELIERQQNIRVAMDLIQRDLTNAGAGMGPFIQVFTNSLDNYTPGSFTQVGSVIVPGEFPDVLEMIVASGDCPDVTLEPSDGCPGSNPCPYSGENLNTAFEFPSCYPSPGFMMIFYEDGPPRLGWGHLIHSGNRKVNFPGGQQPNQSEFGPGIQPSDFGMPNRVGMLSLVRYEIAPDPLDQNVPCLWRSTYGGIDYTDTGGAPPYLEPPGPGWDLIARGVEDLQVQYLTHAAWAALPNAYDAPNEPGAAGFWLDTPGVICGDGTCEDTNAADYGTIVRQVRVTLSASTYLVANLQGESTVAGSPSRRGVRGRLVSATTPREVQVVLSKTSPPPLPLWR